MDEQTEKELQKELELAYQRLEKIKAKMTPEIAEAIKKAIQPQLEELIAINENIKKAIQPQLEELIAINENMKRLLNNIQYMTKCREL